MGSKKYIIVSALLVLILSLAVGGYLWYRNYLNTHRSTIDPTDAQNQINYSLDTKNLLNSKPFISSLPYNSLNFDVYYSSVNDEVQVVMKNKGLSFADAKAADSVEVTRFLQKIGVDLNTQKVVWLLQQ